MYVKSPGKTVKPIVAKLIHIECVLKLKNPGRIEPRSSSFLFDCICGFFFATGQKEIHWFSHWFESLDAVGITASVALDTWDGRRAGEYGKRGCK